MIWWVDEAAAWIQALHWTMAEDNSGEMHESLSVWLCFDLHLSQKLWAVTNRMGLWIQAAKGRFVHTLTGLGIRDKASSQTIQRASELSLFQCIQTAKLYCLAAGKDANPVMCIPFNVYHLRLIERTVHRRPRMAGYARWRGFQLAGELSGTPHKERSL